MPFASQNLDNSEFERLSSQLLPTCQSNQLEKVKFFKNVREMFYSEKKLDVSLQIGKNCKFLGEFVQKDNIHYHVFFSRVDCVLVAKSSKVSSLEKFKKFMMKVFSPKIRYQHSSNFACRNWMDKKMLFVASCFVIISFQKVSVFSFFFGFIAA